MSPVSVASVKEITEEQQTEALNQEEEPLHSVQEQWFANRHAGAVILKKLFIDYGIT